MRRTVQMLVAFLAAGMLAIVACTCPARADALATLRAAEAADARHDYATELTLLRPLAEQGNAHAQFDLGVMYYAGFGVPKDDAEAVRWYRKAADQGDATAQWGLGLMYSRGEGVPRDDAEAIRCYRKSAEQGYALAQYALGIMYHYGRGVPKDDAQAARWLRKAAEQGNAEAQGALGATLNDGLGVPQDYAEAFRWFRRATEQGNVAAQGQLGSMYANGRGVPRNDAEAIRWSRKAAEREDAQAQFFLGAMYYKGRGVRQDDAEAVHWYRKAAQQGNSNGQALLGTMLEEGRGIPRDYVQAYMWYNLAAATGVTQAAHWRDRLELKMTAQQIAEAQQRTAAWRPVHPGKQQQAAPGKSDDPWAAYNPQPIPETPKPPPQTASGQLGTGFFIGEGLLLTNAHVVTGCLWAGIPHQGGSRTAKAKSEYWANPDNWDVAAQVVARDDDNDLALLSATIHPSAVAALRLSVRQGEPIAAYGYPLPGLLASGGNLTTGNITALSGIGDDSRFLQISAPVQPGNSGGPLLDGAGNVVGIVEGKLNAIKVAAAFGDVPQNVNFAIKASVVATFLDSNGIHYATGVSADGRSPADIAENARRFTVPVECSGSAQ